MKTILIALLSMLVFSGCDSSKPVSPTNISDAQKEITFIRSTLAAQLNVSEEQLKSEMPLGELNPPMDEMAAGEPRDGHRAKIRCHTSRGQATHLRQAQSASLNVGAEHAQ